MRILILRKFLVLICIKAGLFISFVNGQVVSPAFRHFTSEDGLPSSEVYCAIQDKSGNIWFGTDRGVARYNGYEFRTYTYSDGLTDNTVFKLFEDYKGRIWMMTYSGKIFYFENEKIIQYKFNNIIFETTRSRMPLGFYIDSSENVFLTLRDIGEIKINTKGELQRRFLIDSLPGVNFLLDEVSPSTAIISHLRYNQEARNYKVLYSKNNLVDTFYFDSPSQGRFDAKRIDDNELYFSYGRSLFKRTNNTVFHLADFSGQIFTICSDNHKNIWAGTDQGVFLYNKLKGNYFNYLVDNNVTCILNDHEGGYWFTTLDNGIFYMPGYGIEGIPFNEGLLQKPTCLTSDYTNSVYAGCWNGSLVQIRGSQAKIIYSPNDGINLPVTNLSSFKNDPRIYLSRTFPGFFFNGSFHPFKVKRFLGIKTNVVKRRDGKLFCGGSSIIFQIKGDSIVDFDTTGQHVNCIALTKDDKIIFGCNRGVFLFDEKTRTTKIFRKELIDIRVDDIKWSNDLLFFATKGKGVLVLSGDSIIEIDERHGMCSNLVNNMMVSGGDVWCTTNKGISHVQRLNQHPLKFKITNIHSSEGLFSDEINDIALLNDTVYVATNSGISFFNSGLDFVNHTQPPVYITSLRVNNTDTVISEAMEFSHDNNNLQIGFNGISYRSNKKIKYRYKLISGTDTLSSITTNREVEFLSLRPGAYKFFVVAMNNSGAWSREPAILSFTINPAWWQTIWFKIFIAFGFTGIIYLFYKNKLKSLKDKFEIEKRQASLQLTAMRAQMNPHFIFNVMNSIRNYMQDHDIKSAEKYLTSFSKLVRYTLDNSEAQEVTLEEELNALRNYTDLEMQRFENGFEFKVVCEEGIDTSETMLLSMLLQPFVENAIKHGISRKPSGGKILVHIKRNGKNIIIAIEDNGVGFKQAADWNQKNTSGHVSHGTAIIFERIEAYNKVYNKNIRTRVIHLTGDDDKATGTRVEIDV